MVNITNFFFFWGVQFPSVEDHSRVPLTRTPKGYKEWFEFAGVWVLTEKKGQGKSDLLWVNGEFDLAEFHLAGFYCNK